MKKYKFLPHTADIKFQASGRTIEEAFSQAAYALREAMCKNKVRAKIKKKISISGKDFESLLYNFLEELLFLLDTQGFLISKIERIKIDKENKKLEAEVLGDKAENYEFDVDVKAITYNDMFVKKEKGKWIVQVVLDV